MKKIFLIAALAISTSACAISPRHGVNLVVISENGFSHIAEFKTYHGTVGLVKESTDFNFRVCQEAANRMPHYKFGRDAYFECRINYSGDSK